MSLMASLPIDSSSAMWNALTTRFDTTDPLARSLTFSELRSKKLDGRSPIKMQIVQLRNLRSAYINSGGTLSDTEWHNIIIQSLTGIWSQFAALGNSITDPEKLLNTLQSEERRKIQNGELKPFTSEPDDLRRISAPLSDHESALLTVTGTKTKLMRVCANCEQPGHSTMRCFAPGGGKEHEAPDWYLERIRKKNSTTKTESATLATTTPFIRHEAYLTVVPRESPTNKFSWIVDSGATAHMANDRSLFTSFRTLPPVDIKSASSSSRLQAVGCGTVKVNVNHAGDITTFTLTMSSTVFLTSGSGCRRRGPLQIQVASTSEGGISQPECDSGVQVFVSTTVFLP